MDRLDVHCQQDVISHKQGQHRHLSGELSYATTVFDLGSVVYTLCQRKNLGQTVFPDQADIACIKREAPGFLR